MALTKQEIRLECLKMAVVVSSPSSHEREKQVVKIAKVFYDDITAIDSVERKKPGPKPKNVGTPS
jgi:beta-phosphoglucomutase-like phosphatase (HAD superfamily)